MALPEVSIIIPVCNGAKWINECFEAIVSQTALAKTFVEIVVFDDASIDDSRELLTKWQEKINDKIPNLEMLLLTSPNPSPRGVGFGRNVAVQRSSGRYLCFQDIDDVMAPTRIEKQLECAADNHDAIVGSRFRREPEFSTIRFTTWANNLQQEQLTQQIYTSHGPTVIMPTWFCTRNIFNKVGGFVENGYGTPEDLIFFYKHLDLNGKIVRVDEELMLYRYHPENTTFSIPSDIIWKLRLERLEKNVLPNWTQFTIWNAGKEGRKFFKSLSENSQKKVCCFCDVDEKKVGRTYDTFNHELRVFTSSIPIKHFTTASPPFIICVKLDMTDGQLEANIDSLKLTEGRDYILFN